MRNAICLTLACVCAACARAPAPAPPDERPLIVSATRGVTGMALISEESGPIGTCSIAIHDGDRDWIATIPGRLEPNQTAVVDWSDFRSRTDRLDGQRALALNDYAATCFMDIEDGLNLTGAQTGGRLTTTLHF